MEHGKNRIWLWATLFLMITSLGFVYGCSDSGTGTTSGSDSDQTELEQNQCNKDTYPNLGDMCEAYYGCYGTWTCKADGSGIYCKPGEECENPSCNKENYPDLGEICEAYYGCYGVWSCNEDGDGIYCKPDEDCPPQVDGDEDGSEIVDQEYADETSEPEQPDTAEEQPIEDGDIEEDAPYEEEVEIDEEPEIADEEYHEFEESSYSGIYEGLEDLFGEALKSALHEIIKVHTALGYSGAREVMFSELDNVNGRVECVYTGNWVVTNDIPPSNEMNTEHTWCQSWGAGSEPMKSDLHHLFPTMSYANSRRSNHPFGVVVSVTWEEGGSKLGYDQSGETVFEPRDKHKGDAARAIFYFSVRYEMSVDDTMEDVLRDWNHLDPPDDWERNRNDRIDHDYQHNRNPFVDHPEFVDRIDDF